MMSRAQKTVVYILMAVLFLCSAGLSEVIRPGHDEYMRASGTVRVGDAVDVDIHKSPLKNTPFDSLLPAVLGVREVMASLMWVQADEYFHHGEYRPIITMVKQITMLDPHQLDVYATGAWHMAYNFMDKRLIADGVKFLQEGTENNDTVYDLFFELGYMHYDKTKDFAKAVEAYQVATTKATTTGKDAPPSYVRHQLAHAMEKMGDIDACLLQWKKNLEIARNLEKGGEADLGPASPNQSAAIHNLYITQRRLNERLAAVAERDHNGAEALNLWQGNVALADASLKEAPGRTDLIADRNHAVLEVDRLKAGKLNPVPPSKLTLHYTITRVAPKKILIEGDLDVLNLSRVGLLFQDKDYAARARDDDPKNYSLGYKMENCTLEWDNVPVNQGHFKHLFDLTKDPADMDRPSEEIYPLKAPDYEIVVSYNPRLQAAFIQDRYGWSGEGIEAADPALMQVDNSRMGTMAGKKYPLRMLEKKIVITRDDVVGAGKKVIFKL